MTPAVPTNTAAMRNSDGVSTPSALTSSGAWASSPTWKVGLLRTLPGGREFRSCLHTGSQGALHWEGRSERAGKAEGESRHSFTKGLAAHVLLAPSPLEKGTATLPRNKNLPFKTGEKASTPLSNNFPLSSPSLQDHVVWLTCLSIFAFTLGRNFKNPLLCVSSFLWASG